MIARSAAIAMMEAGYANSSHRAGFGQERLSGSRHRRFGTSGSQTKAQTLTRHPQWRKAAWSSRNGRRSAATGARRGNARHFGGAAALRRRTGQGSRSKTVGKASVRRDKPSLAECPWPWTDYGKRDSRERRRCHRNSNPVDSSRRGSASCLNNGRAVARNDWVASASEETAISGGCWCTVLVRSLGGSGRLRTKRHGSCKVDPRSGTAFCAG
jgi:hypothetical protein